MVEGIFQRDYAVVQSSMLLVAATFVLVNLLTDIAYAFFDRRSAMNEDTPRKPPGRPRCGGGSSATRPPSSAA